MIKILIASHDRMASGMKASAEFFTGPCDRLMAIDAYTDEQDFEKQIRNYLAKQNDAEQILFLSDLYGGSVNQIMARVMSERKNIQLISGFNFSLLLELMEWNEAYLSEAQLDIMIEQARQSMSRVILKESEAEAFFWGTARLG